MADAFGPFVDALEISTLLAIHLSECHDMLQRLVVGFNEAKDIRALDIEAGGTSEVDLKARIHADHADILASRFGAVARTAGYRELQLGRRPGAPHEFLDADAKPGRILRAEAAPVGTDAGLHCSQTFCVSLP